MVPVQEGGADMCNRERLAFGVGEAVEVVDAVYMAWEEGSLAGMMPHFHEDVEFSVHPEGCVSFIGQGRGKALFFQRVQSFLDEHEVLNYGAPQILPRGGGMVDCRIHYHYRNKASRLKIDGTMRHIWSVVDGKIVRLEVIHDAKRMGAYFELGRLARSAA